MMPHYDDIILPESILLGSGTEFDDSGSVVIRTRAGWQQTVEFTTNPFAVLTIDYIGKTDDARALANILSAVRRSNSFLAINWSNHLTTLRQDQGAIGTQTAADQPLRNSVTGLFEGDGTTTEFQLVQVFSAGSLTRVRRTLKPIAASFLSSGAGTLDATTGVFTFDTAPGNGVPTTWGGRFYTPIYNASAQIVTENFISVPNTQSTGLTFLEALLEVT